MFWLVLFTTLLSIPILGMSLLQFSNIGYLGDRKDEIIKKKFAELERHIEIRLEKFERELLACDEIKGRKD